MRCQHCGHEVPEGSAFCNHCGYSMSNEIICSYCHQPMPSTSVFCPHCGKAVDNAMNVASRETTATAQPTPRPTTYNEQRQAAQQAAGQRQANTWQQSVTDDEEEEEEYTGGGSNFNRNLIIGIVAAILLIALLSLLRHCNSRENDRLEARADSAALIADSSQEPMQILNAELSRNGMTDDKAYTGCPTPTPPSALSASPIRTTLTTHSSRFIPLPAMVHNGRPNCHRPNTSKVATSSWTIVLSSPTP